MARDFVMVPQQSGPWPGPVEGHPLSCQDYLLAKIGAVSNGRKIQWNGANWNKEYLSCKGQCIGKSVFSGEVFIKISPFEIAVLGRF